MKLLIINSLLLVSSVSLACNQKIYDQVYKQIVIETIKDTSVDQQAVQNKRNDTIEVLRSLCSGQLSTYEDPEHVWAGQ